jgi:hypothetical protein
VSRTKLRLKKNAPVSEKTAAAAVSAFPAAIQLGTIAWKVISRKTQSGEVSP